MKKIMISLQMFFLHLAVMAGVTYLIRAVPLVLCRGEVSNRFLRSFLAYVPYAVLGAMTFPAILYTTGNLWSALAGVAAAAVLAFQNKSLVTVAAAACLAVFVA